ncbi:hypothetical protein JL100_036505 (plasmid) [Skermanella mucosa]|uniref:hypothetical protein n=1 Tax=Skermanella mucosa TaxID=1789672 RepID=UPI00192CAE76|nr:hypothetical protein [Skermanella mucosa]UEM25422.1 hypothetical protein JL100_036505 [Skermanella mucosa]
MNKLIPLFFFSYVPEKAQEWIEADTIEYDMPWKLGCGSWKGLIKANYSHAGQAGKFESEYQVYQQLCWMKHSLPKMQDMKMKEGQAIAIYGPHDDERSINHAWFSLEHAGRLTELIISLLLNNLKDAAIEKKLNLLSEQRQALRQKAIQRFGRKNPFQKG